MKAIWNGTVIAESDATEVVEGNHYFPPNSWKQEYFHDSDKTSTCLWKGLANYFDVVVGDQMNDNAAWFYESPLPAASQIKGHVAFWKGVKISE